MDPMVYLNTSTTTNIRPFRYLSFRHTLAGEWSHTVDGMVVRWVWGVNRPGKTCYYYSKEVELDVGWQVYTVDLYDAWNSMPATVWPTTCPMVPWKDETAPVFMFRFEPNENITDFTLHQEVDWIRLTKVDTVRRGQPYTVKTKLNVSASSLASITYYYTDNLSNPTQHIADNFSMNTPLDAAYSTFIPLLSRAYTTGSTGQDPFVGELKPDVSYYWDTSAVNPGTYYICTLLNDGYNQSIYCSEAPVTVTSP
jgi:hypothetical protein